MRKDPGRERVWTVPNALSIARILGVPLFLWLVLGPEADWWALGVLAFAGVSDWLDGKIARAWNQVSRIGTLLDPIADRLYIFAAVLGLVIRGIVPVWLLVVLVLRDVLILGAIPVLRRYGYGPLPVNFAGKAATMCLLYAFPLLFVADYAGIVSNVAQIVGWAFAIWGTALYWWAGALYAVQGRQLLSQARHSDRAGERGTERTDRSGAAVDDPDSAGSTPAPEPGQDRSGPSSGDRKGATSPP